MAPVGRWQQGRDLNWYAKNKEGDSEEAAKRERDEELRRIKEAEQDAMARALGLPLAPRSNANMTPLGGNEVQKAIQESTDADDKAETGRGIGFGSYGGIAMDGAEGETLAAVGMDSQSRPRGQGELGDRGRGPRGHRSRRDISRDTDRRRDRDRDHRDRGTRHRTDKDAHHHDRSEHRHHHHREHREPRRHRSLSMSRSRSPRREHRDRRREENREQRHHPDARRGDGRHERRRSPSPQHCRSNRGMEKDGKRSDHHSPADRHHHDGRRDRDSDRNHRGRRR
jgi:Multiple myeloma tumor-associated